MINRNIFVCAKVDSNNPLNAQILKIYAAEIVTNLKFIRKDVLKCNVSSKMDFVDGPNLGHPVLVMLECYIHWQINVSYEFVCKNKMKACHVHKINCFRANQRIV